MKVKIVLIPVPAHRTPPKVPKVPKLSPNVPKWSPTDLATILQRKKQRKQCARRWSERITSMIAPHRLLPMNFLVSFRRSTTLILSKEDLQIFITGPAATTMGAFSRREYDPDFTPMNFQGLKAFIALTFFGIPTSTSSTITCKGGHRLVILSWYCTFTLTPTS